MALENGAEQEISAIYAELRQRADADLARLGAGGAPTWTRYGYLRYRGQGYEIRANLPDGPVDESFPAAAAASFHAAYEQAYGYHDAEAAIEAVDWHLVATLPQPAGALDLGWRAPAGAMPAARMRQTWHPEAGGFIETPIHDRPRLPAGAAIAGPAIIEDPESTLVVPSGMLATVTERGHILIDIGQVDRYGS